MNATPESVRARRYLLRQASDEECAVLEQEYLEHEEAVDRIAGAEDDLIEDYLAARLSAADRERFERAYLSAPHHRVRVETIRRLMAQPGQPGRATGEKVLPFSPKRLMRHGAWLALAASLLVVASAALWMSSSFRGRPPQIVDTVAPQPSAPVAPSQTTSPSTPPRAFAVTLPPVSVRSASESASVVIPAGTGTVTIRLESDPDNRTLTARRASLRTIGGREVWQGPLTPDGNPPGVIARIDVPAATVPPDDYLVTLFGIDRAGAERELAQYFLRVRGR